MKTDLNITITTAQQADAFITELFNNGELFHFDDDLENIIFDNGTVATAAEIEQMDHLLEGMFNLPDYDPFGTVCKLLNIC